MAKVKGNEFLNKVARLFQAHATKDEMALAELIETTDDDTEGGDMDADSKRILDSMKVSLDALIAKDAARDAAIAEEKAAKEEADKKAAAKDALISAESAPAAPDLGKLWTGDTLTEIVSRAEILAPGIVIPTNDGITPPSNKSVEGFLLKALTVAQGTTDGADAIKPFLMGKQLSTLTGDHLMGTFTGAAELIRARNNRSNARPAGTFTQDHGSKPRTVQSIQEMNDKFWAGQK